MKRIFWKLQATAFYILTLVAAGLPASITCRMGTLAGFLIPRLIPSRRAIAVDNIRRALPFMRSHRLWKSSDNSAEELAAETFKNLGRSLMEICRLYHGKGEDVISCVEIQGLEYYKAAKAKGKGLIFFSGHCGNWELLALALSRLLGESVSGVARKQNNPYLNRIVEQMRMRYNNKVLYKKGALKGILSALKKEQLVGLLADQAVIPQEGALIDVLGRKAWVSKAPVVIAQKSGAPLLPVFIHREGKKHIITFYPEQTFSGDMTDEGVQRDIQALSRYVENFIIEHPTQWYWVHRRWKRAGEISDAA